jgi:opacity protein-like surface antigen
MKLKSSIIAILALSSMSFAGGDIGGVTTFENSDIQAAEVEAVEPEPIIEEAAPVVAEPAPQPAPQPEPEPAPKVEPKKPEPVVEKPSAMVGPYVGGALSALGTRTDDRVNLFSDEDNQDRQIGITGVLGYNFMEYLGAELRAVMGVAKDKDNKRKQVGLYLKPQYPIKDIGLNIYGLLGYAKSNMSDACKLTGTNNGFSYGAGVDYGVTENISVFTDVVNHLKDDDTNSQWGANFGVKYNF